MTGTGPTSAKRCAACGTELAAQALACPACHALVHADRLKLLAARADQLTAAGKLREARATWDEALTLLPATSQQHAAIAARLEALVKRITDEDPELGDAAATAPQGPWYKRWAAGIGATLLLIVTKGKFLLLGLTKLPTVISMFGFFGVYWAAFGWPLALGIAVSFYIHEMGHVAAILRLGGRPSAPMFIPGIGAFVSYSRRITDPREDAYIALAGPIYGAGAGIVALAVGKYTGEPVWLAIAELNGFINLLNLTPFIWLDGAHAFKALDRPQRILVAVAFGVAWWLSGLALMILPLAVTVWRVFVRDQGPGDARTLANFFGLIAVLTWLATLDVL